MAGLSNDRNVLCAVTKEELRTTANAIVRGLKTQEPNDQESGPENE